MAILCSNNARKHIGIWGRALGRSTMDRAWVNLGYTPGHNLGGRNRRNMAILYNNIAGKYSGIRC